MALISDRIANVQDDLGNRTDLTTTKISRWLLNAYLDLSYNVNFEEQFDIRDMQTKIGLDTYAYPPTARAIKYLQLILPDGQTSVPLDRRSFKDLAMYNIKQQGQPSIYVPYTLQNPGPGMVVQ